MTARDIRRLGRDPVVLACGLLAATWVVTLTLHPWADESVGDLGVRRHLAAEFLGGALPYRDVDFEYPPLAAPLIALPGLLGTGQSAYWAGFAVLNLCLAVAVLLLAGRLAAATGGDARRAMLAAAAAPLLVGAVVRLHFDLAAVALVLAALLALVSRRTALAFVLLGLGTMTKAFPLVVAPVAVAWLLGRGERRAALRGCASLIATLAAVGALAVALSPAGSLAAVRYQSERPVQVESTPASVLLAIDRLGGEPARMVSGYGSTGVEHPLDDEVVAAFTAALVGLLAGLAVATFRRARDAVEATAGARSLVLSSLSAVAGVAALGKVLSPQFLLWVLPLLALAWAWRMRALTAAVAAALALTLAEFPSRYVDLVANEPLAVAITAVRNAALLATVVLATATLTRRRRAEQGSARRRRLAHRPRLR